MLGPLADEMVFLGGCAVGLLLTDPAAPAIRVTQDVDAIVEVTSKIQCHRLSKRLRERGFVEDVSPEAPICRWMAEGVLVDVMPTKTEILGFANTWYAQAFEMAEAVSIPNGKRIRMVTAPYFLATKLEAFHGRGAGDYHFSQDMEDIVAVLDGRPEVVVEAKRSEARLRAFLSESFAALLEDRNFMDALPGHLPPDEASQARLPLILERIRVIAEHSR